MPDGGTLAIETDACDLGPEYCEGRPWARAGRYTRLRVRDDGVGMDPETVERVFEPFFTTKGQGKGTGLGLATVYGIVKQHEGMIDVDSAPGAGATFSVYLPVEVESAAAPGSRVDAGAPPSGTETVLLAEDDPMVCALGRRILERAGYSVLIAADGEEAVRVFTEHEPDIALAVLDVVMPRMSGRDAYERMRHRRPDLPAVFVSGYSDVSLAANPEEPATHTLLTKPYAPAALLRTVRQMLDR
jgi:CheY-like chemotaxis protein